MNKEPRFGARVFRYPNNELNASNPACYVMEFKKDAGPRLNYDEEMNMIIIEHLVSQSVNPIKKAPWSAMEITTDLSGPTERGLCQ